jgi:15-cis-phytoene synthase
VLPADCRVAIRTARLCYAEIGHLIGRADFDSLSQRAVVPGWHKLWLLLQAAAVSADGTSDGLAAPSLPCTEFLVSCCADQVA